MQAATMSLFTQFSMPTKILIFCHSDYPVLYFVYWAPIIQYMYSKCVVLFNIKSGSKWSETKLHSFIWIFWETLCNVNDALVTSSPVRKYRYSYSSHHIIAVGVKLHDLSFQKAASSEPLVGSSSYLPWYWILVWSSMLHHSDQHERPWGQGHRLGKKFVPMHDKTYNDLSNWRKITLLICSVWSESLLIACAFYSLWAIQTGKVETFSLIGMVYRLIFAGHIGLIVGFVVCWLINVKVFG